MADCVANWTMILEYLKVFLSWPAITATCVLVALGLFRKEIRDLIGNTESLDAGKLKAKFRQRGGDVPETSLGRIAAPSDGSAIDARPDMSLQGAAVSTATASGALSAPAHDAREQSELKIIEQFANDPKFADELLFARQQPAATVGQYRQIVKWFKFERAMNRIFGSQVRLLVQLAAQPLQPLDHAEVRVFYNDYQSASKDATYPMTAYVDFLITYNGFLRRISEGNSDKYLIEPLGTEFLDYIRMFYPDAWDKRWG